MIVIITLFLLNVFALNSTEEYRNGSGVDHYIVACHSTDFTCFQTQFQYLRDIAMYGSEELGVSVYRHHQVKYSDTNTCVNMTGAEAAQLDSINFNGNDKMLTLTVTMPLRLQQIAFNTTCQNPEKVFPLIGAQQDHYKHFTCNATMVLQFPFTLYKQKHHTYMTIDNEDLDVVLDIPDFSNYNRSSKLETRLFELSEWAYEVVQHVNVPDHVMVPLMQSLRLLFIRLPLDKLILLYPTEQYNELVFNYTVSKEKNYYTEH